MPSALTPPLLVHSALQQPCLLSLARSSQCSWCTCSFQHQVTAGVSCSSCIHMRICLRHCSARILSARQQPCMPSHTFLSVCAFLATPFQVRVSAGVPCGSHTYVYTSLRLTPARLHLHVSNSADCWLPRGSVAASLNLHCSLPACCHFRASVPCLLFTRMYVRLRRSLRPFGSILCHGDVRTRPAPWWTLVLLYSAPRFHTLLFVGLGTAHAIRPVAA